MNIEKEILRDISIEIAEAINALSDGSTQATKEVIPIVQKLNNLDKLRIVLSDLLEWSQDIEGTELHRLDQRLISKGLPSLTNMRDSQFRKLCQILYRGKIKDKSEYSFLLSYLNDTTNTALSDNDIDKANKLLMSFEKKSEQNT